MEYLAFLQAMFLGIVQGITEFLPISSSAHLQIVPWLFAWQTPGLVFDTSLHLGTAAALLYFFRQEYTGMARALLPHASKHTTSKDRQQHRLLIGAIIAGIVPAGIVGLLFDDHIAYWFSDALLPITIFVVAANLVFFGVLMYLADRWGKQNRTVQDIRPIQGLTIGLFQVLALLPGVSRSGSTMTMAMALGYTREDAARFSFLMGTPIIILAGLFQLKDLFAMPIDIGTILYFLLGVGSSFVTGLIVITYFLQYLKRHTVAVFTLYRILLALFISLFAILT